MPFRNLAFIFILIFAFISTCSPKKENSFVENEKPVIYLPEFATGFKIEQYKDYKRVTVNNPFQGSNSSETYILVPRGSKIENKYPGEKVIETPVSRIVCTSTTHIPLLEYLGEANALKGFPSLDYISSEVVRELINDGKVAELGSQMNMNMEVLLSLEPDMVMGYTMTGDLGELAKVEETGVPVIINAEYLESHPLGRAEWIKFMAVFFEKGSLADSIFNVIREEYIAIRKQVSEIENRPSVLSGVVYGDTWFLPGGNNYASKIIEDAGGAYLWENDSSSGYLELSFETVYSKSVNADFWVGVASYNSLDQLVEGDGRYAQIKAFKDRNVYSYNRRIGSRGGNEYLELGYLRPDLILKDLVQIFHPNLQKNYSLYFYEQLK